MREHLQHSTTHTHTHTHTEVITHTHTEVIKKEELRSKVYQQKHKKRQPSLY